MAKINVLDKSIYNLISAGEVVENPASIVKELVENSIDAGADTITVNIENGGIKSITVIDNGTGIEEDDMLLTIVPHATSKISQASDLDTVSTLGFRGEALASIAAVSCCTIKSRYFESDFANFIEVKGGEIVNKGVCGLNVGTQISVNSLFFNTPARYKFLKNSKGEESKVTALMRDLIFANPTLNFTYTADGKCIYKTYGEGLDEALCAVFGEDVAAQMLPIEIQEKGYKISGFTAQPASDAICSNRTKQIFIVNGRVIKDETLSAVINNAYGEYLMKRTFPTVVLDIIMPFEMVDVNVHPNKREVRFADPKKINGLVYHAIKNAVEEHAEETQQEIFSLLYKENTVQEPPKVSVIESIIEKETIVSEPKFSVVPKPIETYTYKPNAEILRPISDSVKKVTFADSEPRTNAYMPSYRTIGQLFDTYLLIELNNDIIFIDQHAAHERILFDGLMEAYERAPEVQDMLVPYFYATDYKDLEFFSQIGDELNKIGFKNEVVKGGVNIKSVPCIVKNLDLNGFLHELSDYNRTPDRLISSEIIKDKIAKIACKKAIKGGDRLTDEQIDYVLDYFFTGGVPLQCPHGRPTMFKMSREEIEKRFGRRV